MYSSLAFDIDDTLYFHPSLHKIFTLLKIDNSETILHKAHLFIDGRVLSKKGRKVHLRTAGHRVIVQKQSCNAAYRLSCFNMQ